jgi:hypothetical protein
MTIAEPLFYLLLGTDDPSAAIGPYVATVVGRADEVEDWWDVRLEPRLSLGNQAPPIVTVSNHGPDEAIARTISGQFHEVFDVYLTAWRDGSDRDAMRVWEGLACADRETLTAELDSLVRVPPSKPGIPHVGGGGLSDLVEVVKSSLREFGTPFGPSTHREGRFYLGSSVIKLQGMRMAGRLPGDLEDELSSIPGWVWWEHDSEEAIRRYGNQEGSLDIPSDLVVGGHYLAVELRFLRGAYQTGRMSQERREAVESIPGWS